MLLTTRKSRVVPKGHKLHVFFLEAQLLSHVNPNVNLNVPSLRLMSPEFRNPPNFSLVRIVPEVSMSATRSTLAAKQIDM